MPFRWTFSEEEELVYVVGQGPVDLASAVETLFLVAGNPRFLSHWRVLVDLREMEYEPQPKEAVEMARVLGVSKSMLQGRVAVVVAAPVRPLAGLAASLASQNGAAVREFTDPAEARVWLFPAEAGA